MEKPYFSIIIPTYNEEKFLPNLLSSLALQQKKNFEVIVVDGKSEDKTIEVAKTYKDKLSDLKVIRSDRPSLPYQRNLGAKEAAGIWYLFIDADTILLPYFIERLDVFIKSFHPELLTTWCRADSEIPADGVLALLANIFYEASIWLKRPLSPGSLTAVEKETFNMVGGYDDQLTFAEDWDLSTRLYKKGVKLHIIRETLYIFSLRRFRKMGKLKVLQSYLRGIISVLLTNKVIKDAKGYVMGGHIYEKKKRHKRPLMRKFKSQIRKLFNEFFK